jgi:hypothetical protein
LLRPHIKVDPNEISPEERNLKADRLCGIDVCELRNPDYGTTSEFDTQGQPPRLRANGPTYEELISPSKSPI